MWIRNNLLTLILKRLDLDNQNFFLKLFKDPLTPCQDEFIYFYDENIDNCCHPFHSILKHGHRLFLLTDGSFHGTEARARTSSCMFDGPHVSWPVDSLTCLEKVTVQLEPPGWDLNVFCLLTSILLMGLFSLVRVQILSHFSPPGQILWGMLIFQPFPVHRDSF